MAQNATNLVWIDLEMTGLDPETEKIIEIATVVTDVSLEVLSDGPEIAICQTAEVLAAMDKWNTEQHGRSGLVERVLASTCGVAEACLLYTSPSPRDGLLSRMPSSA